MAPLPQTMKHAANVLLMLLSVTICCCDSANLRLQLTHVDAGRGLTGRERLHRMTQRSAARAMQLLSARSGDRSASAPVNPGAYGSIFPYTEYLVHLSVGTPPQEVQLTLDTGSDLVWTQCQPCPASDCFHQTLPLFDSSASSSFASLPCSSTACENPCANDNQDNLSCNYRYSYGDGSVAEGEIGNDTFTFGTGDDAGERVAVPGLVFGCGHANNGIFTSNETGIAGFGRGALSLPSQLKVDNFSHCFTNITGSQSSTVLLGLPANLYGSGNGNGSVIQSTPFVQSPSRDPTKYYISLKGVTVGSERLQIPESMFALQPNGTGGTIIDSGLAITSLPEDAYKQVCHAFESQLDLPRDTNYSDEQPCFKTSPGSTPDVPRLAFHLEGATLDLPQENYVFKDANSNVLCLVIDKAKVGEPASIGNYQQQNMHVLYDLQHNMLSFVPAQCDQL
ncbi:hypothetical protein GUJ93_ZPchr0003g17187 [Zizania palustris]|uniref:Peptidase A1 domain-containing protein n=1 Tax=Zizania palustris TaxID=103762 RepID=A0A8J5VEN9_ZIZPA|nr:hypothetical protein GUJ93_ZPchr0003g17187 [Zizania palustris]